LLSAGQQKRRELKKILRTQNYEFREKLQENSANSSSPINFANEKLNFQKTFLSAEKCANKKLKSSENGFCPPKIWRPKFKKHKML
jgi:hypothetical protein